MKFEQMGLPFDDDLDVMEIEPEPLPEHCETCGEYGACAYDGEGRALVHTTRFDIRDE